AGIERARALVSGLPEDATFTTTFAALVLTRPEDEVGRIARTLAFSNEQRNAVQFAVAHQRDLDDPDALPLAALKRLMADAAFDALLSLAIARYSTMRDGARRTAKLTRRLAAISPEQVAPQPLVTGEDLLSRGVPQGPQYARILDALYTRQL